ncbi:endolytic transglycosylase MltG [Spongisporangium articulatum]|uniref:Endolytic murein transglycosylase n=1 Tax=Spongisporangium articulatum TaxID=3362603 RepID=A0ABW8AR70_9ACTN
MSDQLSHVLPGFQPQQDPQWRGDWRKAKKKRKTRRRRRALLTVLIFLLVMGGGGAAAYIGLAPVVRKLTAPKDYTGTGTGEVQVKIPPGASGRTIAKVLTEAGVTKTQVAFVTAFNANPKAASIQPGTYKLRKQMSGASAVSLLLDPDSRLEVVVTIPEGARAKYVYATLAKALDLPRSDFTRAVADDAIGLPAAAKGQAEGFLFPATYEFEPDTTAAQALSDMVDRGHEAYVKLGISKSDLREVVIKASIVQAEAGDKKYMGPVARVLDNRLKGHYKLQLDSTVSYAVQRFEVTTTKQDRASTSHYNTYRYEGLPVGPISNPGEEALEAVLHPPKGSWLFFVTTNPSTGETKFATTSAGHARNVAEFQAWLRAHPDGR